MKRFFAMILVCAMLFTMMPTAFSDDLAGGTTPPVQEGQMETPPAGDSEEGSPSEGASAKDGDNDLAPANEGGEDVDVSADENQPDGQSAGGDQQTGDQSADNQSTGDQQTDDQSTDDQSTDDQSTDDQSTDDQSTDDQSTDDQSTDDQSTDDQSTDDQSTDDQQTDNQSTDDQSTDDQSTDNQSTGDQQTDDQSTDQQTDNQSTDNQTEGDGEGNTSAVPESVQKVQALIDALPDASAVSSMQFEEVQALNGQLSAVADAYKALPEEERAMVTGIAKLENLGNVLASHVNQLAVMDDPILTLTAKSNLTYTGGEQQLLSSASCDPVTTDMTFSYTVTDGSGNTVKSDSGLSSIDDVISGATATAAGSYTVKASVTVNSGVLDNPTFGSNTVTVTIEKAILTSVLTVDGYYDGTEKTVAASLTGVAAADAGKVSLKADFSDQKLINVGYYSANLSLEGERAANYTLKYNTASAAIRYSSAVTLEVDLIPSIPFDSLYHKASAFVNSVSLPGYGVLGADEYILKYKNASSADTTTRGPIETSLDLTLKTSPVNFYALYPAGITIPTMNVAITPAKPEMRITLTADSFPYKGSAYTIDEVVSSVKAILPNDIDLELYDVYSPECTVAFDREPVGPGTYTVTATMTEDWGVIPNNNGVNGYVLEIGDTGTATFFITEPEPVYELSAVAASSLTYNGSKQDLGSCISTILTCGDKAVDTYELVYSLSADPSVEAPAEAINADDYTVYVSAVVGGEIVDTEPVTVTIAKATPTLTADIVDSIETYRQGITKEEDLVNCVKIVDVNGEELDTLSAGEYTSSFYLDTRGYLEVSIELPDGWKNTTENQNYTGLGAASSVEKSVKCSDGYELNASVENEFFTYTGVVQEVQVKATLYDLYYKEITEGISFEYKLGNGAWSSSLPKITNAGQYTVHVRASLNSTVVAEVSRTFTVSKAHPDVKINLKSDTIYLHPGETLTDGDIFESVTVNGTLAKDYKVYYNDFVQDLSASDLYTGFEGYAWVSFPNGMGLDENNYIVGLTSEYYREYFTVSEPYYRLEVTPAEGRLVWTGEPQLLISAKVFYGNREVTEGVELSFLDEDNNPISPMQTEVGSYTYSVTATVDGYEYNLEDYNSYTVEIGHFYELKLVDKEVVYDDGDHAFTDAVDVTLLRDGVSFSDDVEFMAATTADGNRTPFNELPTKCTTYKTPVYVYAYVDGKEVAEGNIMWGLKPAELKLTLGNARNVRYNGSAHEFSSFYNYHLEGVVGNDSVSVEFATDELPMDAGTYEDLPIKLTNPNYELSADSPKEVDVTIGKAAPVVEFSLKGTLFHYEQSLNIDEVLAGITVNGQPFDRSSGVADLGYSVNDGPLIRLSADTDMTGLNTGDNVRLALKFVDDYANDDNYSPIPAYSDVFYSGSFSIFKTHLNVTAASGLVYNGAPQKLLAAIDYDDGGIVSSFSYTVTSNGNSSSGNFSNEADISSVLNGITATEAGPCTVTLNLHYGQGRILETETVEVTIGKVLYDVDAELFQGSISVPFKGEAYTADELAQLCLKAKPYGLSVTGELRADKDYSGPALNGATNVGEYDLTLNFALTDEAYRNYGLDDDRQTVSYGPVNVTIQPAQAQLRIVHSGDETSIPFSSDGDVMLADMMERVDISVTSSTGGFSQPLDKSLFDWSFEANGSAYTLKAELKEAWASGNYSLPFPASASISFTMRSTALTVTPASGLTYTAQPQQLLTDLGFEIGENNVSFSYTVTAEDGTYHSGHFNVGNYNKADILEAITATNAGAYTVTLNMHLNAGEILETETVTVTIAPAKIKLVDLGYRSSIYYDGKEHDVGEFYKSPTFEGLPEGVAAPKLTSSGTAINAGFTKITGLGLDNPNLELAEGSSTEATADIAPLDVDILFTNLTKTYGAADDYSYTLSIWGSSERTPLMIEAENMLNGRKITFNYGGYTDVGTYPITGWNFGGYYDNKPGWGDWESVGNFRYFVEDGLEFTITKKPVDRIRGTLFMPTYNGTEYAATAFVNTARDDWYLMDKGETILLKVDPLKHLTFSIKGDVKPIDVDEYTLVIGLDEEEKLAKNYSFGTQEVTVRIEPAEGDLEVSTLTPTYTGGEFGPEAFIDKVCLVTADGTRIDLGSQYTASFGNSSTINNVSHGETITVEESSNNVVADPASITPVIERLPVTFTLNSDFAADYGTQGGLRLQEGDVSWTAAEGVQLTGDVTNYLNSCWQDMILFNSGETLNAGEHPITYVDLYGCKLTEEGFVHPEYSNYTFRFNPNDKQLTVNKLPVELELKLADDLDLTYTSEKNYGMEDLGFTLLVKERETGETLEALSLEQCIALGIECYMGNTEYNIVETETGNAGFYKAYAEVPESAMPNYDYGDYAAATAPFTLKKQAAIGMYVAMQCIPYDGEAHELSDFIDPEFVDEWHLRDADGGKIVGVDPYTDLEFVFPEGYEGVVEPGEYDVEVYLAGELAKNYDYPGMDIYVEIVKAEAVIDVSAVPTEYIYTGKLQRVTGAVLNHTESELTSTANTFTTVAEGDGMIVTFSAAETDHYTAANVEVMITVSPAAPGDAAYPTVTYPAAGSLTYGQSLSESTLTGGSAELGSFAWAGAEAVPAAGLNVCEVVFTPNDTENFAWGEDDLMRTIEIIIEPRPATITVDSASKIYGDADPEAAVSTENVLAGDALDYAVTREAGENVGEYAYAVVPGENPDYVIDTLVGTLTINARSISDEAVKVSKIGSQTYTGSAIKPKPVVKLNGETLKKGVDYTLSYSGNTEPGTATITITGIGNFTGTDKITFTIVEPVKEPEAPVEEETAETVTGEEAVEALNKLLGSELAEGEAAAESVFELVFNADYQPESFEILNAVVEDETMGNSLLVCAFPNEEGKTEQRSLMATAAQLARLADEQKTEHVIFENGNAIAVIDMVDVLEGDLSKLMALILEGAEEITAETAARDWSTVEAAEITAADLAKFSIEIRIVPVEQEDGSTVYEVSVWLHWNDQALDVSGMIPSLNVCLTVDELVNAENVGTFTTLYTMAHQAPDAEAVNLESTLVLIPDALPEHQEDEAERFMVTIADAAEPVAVYEAVALLEPYRHYALAAEYAGEGVYFVKSNS